MDLTSDIISDNFFDANADVLFNLAGKKRIFHFRSGRRQPAGGRVRERPASARRGAQKDRGVGHLGGAAVRHQQAAARLSRLRVQDPD